MSCCVTCFLSYCYLFFFFFKQKTAYEMRISDWSSDVCSSDLLCVAGHILSLPLLALLGFIGAAGTVAYSVAAPPLIPALVPPAQPSLANGRIELASTVAFAAAPAVAGALAIQLGAASGRGRVRDKA